MSVMACTAEFRWLFVAVEEHEVRHSRCAGGPVVARRMGRQGNDSALAPHFSHNAEDRVARAPRLLPDHSPPRARLARLDNSISRSAHEWVDD